MEIPSRIRKITYMTRYTLETLFYGNAVSTEIKAAFSDSALKILSKLGCENPNVNKRCKSRECTCLSHDYCK